MGILKLLSTDVPWQPMENTVLNTSMGQVRLRGQWLKFLGKEKETPKEHTVLMKRVSETPSWRRWLQTQSGVATLHQDVQTHRPKPPWVEEASSAVTLLCHPCPWVDAGWCPPGKWAHYLCLQAWGGGEHPIWQDEALGLNSALGYVPATPAADGALPLAPQPGAGARGFLGLSKNAHTQIHQDKMKEKAEFRRQSCLSCVCREAL